MTGISFKKTRKARTRFALLLLLVLNTMTALAQNKTTANMEELKLKSKPELIQIAFEILKEKQPSVVINADDFESSAWGNSKEIIVKFRRYIRFIPLNADPKEKISYDVTVNLNTNEISPFDDYFKSEFYIETEEDKKAIAFVKENSIPIPSDFEITISEKLSSYWINRNSKTTFCHFFIEKKTGVKSGVMEGSFSVNQVKSILEPFDESEEMIEIYDSNELKRIRDNFFINIAKDLLREAQPLLDFNDYCSFVLSDSNYSVVQFKRIIRYFPLGTNPEKRISYDIKVNLNTNKISPFDDILKSEFYIETKEDKKALEFVKKNFGILGCDFENTIYETAQGYLICCDNQYGFRRYDLNKKTGEYALVDEFSSHPEPELTQKINLDYLLKKKIV